MHAETGNIDGADSFGIHALHQCIFLKSPFPECYCMHVTSTTISKLLAFCAGDFTSCRIYRHRAGKNAPVA